jgi:hypothetical protein
MKVNIHNQCSNFELEDLEYFNNGADWNKEPDWWIRAGGIESAVLKPFLSTFEGFLAYELQKKHVKFDNLLKSTDVRLFVNWKCEGYTKFHVFAQLIECDRVFYGDKITLKEYYRRYSSQLGAYTGPIKDTWLISDGTVLVTRLELDFTQKDWRDGVLNITISKGTRDKHTKRPVWFDLGR